MVREGLGGSPPYPIPEQETESLNAMKLSSLVHMTNFIPAIQTISRRVRVFHRGSACAHNWPLRTQVVRSLYLTSFRSPAGAW